MNADGELWKLTATRAAPMIRAGKLNPIDLTEACLARVAEREAAVRAFTWFDRDYVWQADDHRHHHGPL